LKPYHLIFDGALWRPDLVREHALGLDYRGEIGPDGVTYPNISADVPRNTRGDLEYVLSRAVGSLVDVKLCFFRLNLADTVVPHWAHTDTIMADYASFVYLSRPEDCRGGTAIIEHVSGMKRHPTTQAEADLWRQDTNRPERWVPKTLAPMAFNRLVVLPSDIFHAATPTGFGSCSADGRLVLITFFSRKEN
jgi:hypothetical protein